MKTCTKCKEEKEHYLFPINKKASDLRGSWCNDCVLAYRKSKRKKVAGPQNKSKDKQFCIGCAEEKDIKEFALKRFFKRVREPLCLECMRQKQIDEVSGVWRKS